jgi:hypothetical protein
MAGFDESTPLGRGSKATKARAAKAKRLKELRAMEAGVRGGGKRTFEAAVKVLKGGAEKKKEPK